MIERDSDYTVTTNKKNTTMTTTRNIYFRINERGFANEYEVLKVQPDDKPALEAIKYWASISPNGYLRRIKRSELSTRQLESAMPISEFYFAWGSNDGEERQAKEDFNNLEY